jgi:hypothetical protein
MSSNQNIFAKSNFEDSSESSFEFLKNSRHEKTCFLPMAGNRNHSNGSLNPDDFGIGSNGNYWSSTVSSTNARNLNFNSSNANMNTNNRANGFSVRCIKDCYTNKHLSRIPASFFTADLIKVNEVFTAMKTAECEARLCVSPCRKRLIYHTLWKL